jgi:glycosyltransferase involved in cell wall biosynthesis
MSKGIAFVVQRCGIEVNGGAEQHCLMVARRLAARYRTEVLSTCALDYATWADHYPPGEEWIGEVCIRRFRVQGARDVRRFDRLSEAIRPRIGTLERAEEERWMCEQGPWAPDLLDYLRAHKGDYDAFVFFTYLYATTYFGLPLVADKALLAPTAHDEWPIHLGIWDALFELPRAFIFNSEEEAAFLRRRFPKARLNGPIVGVAVEPPGSVDAHSFRRTYGIHRPFLLYVGRIDPSKGVDELLEHFQTYRRSSGGDRVELVLVGKPVVEIAPRPGVRILGFVPEEHKWGAIAACEALVMPSRYESLSMACLEAWSLARPVLVTAASDVLVAQCRRSQGGLWYGNGDEFSAALDVLLCEPTVAKALGRQGERFVRENYRWPRILDAYGQLVSDLTRPSAPT